QRDDGLKPFAPKCKCPSGHSNRVTRVCPPGRLSCCAWGFILSATTGDGSRGVKHNFGEPAGIKKRIQPGPVEQSYSINRKSRPKDGVVAREIVHNCSPPRRRPGHERRAW